MKQYDVIVVGSGILGLSHAYHARLKGYSVAVFEKNSTQLGASIRNFGNFWPIGQRSDNGDLEKAYYGRETYLDLGKKAGFWITPTGSWHLANTLEEQAVFEEFLDKGNKAGYNTSYVNKDKLKKYGNLINFNNVGFALYSNTECTINPRKTVPLIAKYLEEEMNVSFYYNSEVQHIDNGKIYLEEGVYKAEKVLVCTGYEAWQFFKESLKTENIKPCKLQMMKTVPQKSYKLPVQIATGLSCRHYKSFNVCTDTLPALEKYVANNFPELDKWGIHLLATQNDENEVVLGDTHEYGEPTPFNKEKLDNIVLELTKKYLNIPDMTINQRWFGIYLKHFEKSYFRIEPQQGIYIVNGVGGNGMTLSFGIGKETVENW